MPSAWALRVIMAAKLSSVCADRLGDRDRDVVRRTGHDGLDRVLDADRFARLKAELRGLLRRGVRGDRNLGLKRHRAAIELLEQQVERHHLGDRGRMAQSVLVRRIERLAAIGVDDERRKRGRSGNRGDRLADEMDAPAMRVACVKRRMRHGRVIAVMPIMMRLGGPAGEEKGRTGDQAGRRQTGKPADSRATATQRHERALFDFTQRLRPSRPPLRNSHGRERYVGAVTRRLTRRGVSDVIVGKLLELPPSA